MITRASALCFVGLLACGGGGDGKTVDPPPDPVPDPMPDPMPDPDDAVDDPLVVCAELGPILTEMVDVVAEAETVPRDRALYVLAAQLSRADRVVADLDAELVIVDAELASADFALRPPRYRELRRAELTRLEAVRQDALAEQAALRDQAARSVYPPLAEAEGPERVLASLRWREAGPVVTRYQQGCRDNPAAVDGARVRDLVSGMILLDNDGHGVGVRMIEDRILSGQDLNGVAP